MFFSPSWPLRSFLLFSSLSATFYMLKVLYGVFSPGIRSLSLPLSISLSRAHRVSIKRTILLQHKWRINMSLLTKGSAVWRRKLRFIFLIDVRADINDCAHYLNTSASKKHNRPCLVFCYCYSFFPNIKWKKPVSHVEWVINDTKSLVNV